MKPSKRVEWTNRAILALIVIAICAAILWSSGKLDDLPEPPPQISEF